VALGRPRINSLRADSDLQAWAKVIAVEVTARIAGHSGVHQVQKDCEMHFGGTVPGYRGAVAHQGGIWRGAHKPGGCLPVQEPSQLISRERPQGGVGKRGNQMMSNRVFRRHAC
jgi:hypothetical protein